VGEAAVFLEPSAARIGILIGRPGTGIACPTALINQWVEKMLEGTEQGKGAGRQDSQERSEYG